MKHFILTVAAITLGISAMAQTVRGEWDVHFQAALINDEFDASNCVLAPSGTIGAFNFSPYAGISFGNGHRLKTGFNVQRDFGTEGDKPKVELAAWYQYNNDNGFTLAAGIFPYALMGGRYTTATFSESARFFDVHCDGLLLRWQKEKSNYEIALDWCGKYGETRREEFYFVTAGAGWVNDWMALCWEGTFHHFANSDAVQGVVDDHFIHPYVEFEFSPLLPLQRMEVSLGGMFGYHRDRRYEKVYLPKGADIVVDVRKWNFGIKNQFYYGENQMPLYHETDNNGMEYAGKLYFRAPWWQIRRDGQPGIYDRLDLYWIKHMNDFVTLGVHAVFHFDHLGYLGCQQFFQANVNLDKLLFKK